jgi:hypothetical protein
MTKDKLSAWALGSGWKLIGGHPSLSKPSRPGDAIVRMVLKATVVNVEIRKPAGKWEKVSGASYSDVQVDADTGVPRGLGLVSIPGLTKLMQDNRDSMMFSKLTGAGRNAGQ